MTKGQRPKPSMPDVQLYGNAFQGGYDTALAGGPAKNWPHTLDADEAHVWLQGWAKGQRDLKAGLEQAHWTDDPNDPDYHPKVDCFNLDTTLEREIPEFVDPTLPWWKTGQYG